MSWTPDPIEYLKKGNNRQRRVYEVLSKHLIMAYLGPFNPILVSSICVGIDTIASDLDIVCEFSNQDHFEDTVRLAFSAEVNFLCCCGEGSHGGFVSAQFEVEEFLIDIYGEAYPVRQQNAYRHLVLAARLLEYGGAELREKICEVREKRGCKFEAAFAELFELPGDPYQAFLELEKRPEDQLRDLCRSAALINKQLLFF